MIKKTWYYGIVFSIAPIPVITSTDWKDVPMGDFTFYDPPYRDSFANYITSFPDSETEEAD